MARWTARITTIVTVLMLTGAPAVLAACAALCTSGMTGGQDRDTPLLLPSTHHHHEMASDAQSEPAMGRGGAASPSAVGRIAGHGHDCCPDGQALGLNAVAAGRQDTQGASAVVGSQISPVAVWLPVKRARVPGATRWPPSPPRTSAVLRI